VRHKSEVILAESLKARVVGAGYVGLVSGACLYQLGYRAACVDEGKARLRRLREGRLPFYEPSRFARVCKKTLSWFPRTREHIGGVS
jgi:UDP-glucose 6-dehydrogenase